ncbi:MAG: aldo/keto reductase [Candidatus Bipolaricaulota bacterium]
MKTRSFGPTDHDSSVAIFGGAALAEVSQDEADRVLETLLEYGVNHIDVAPAYGDAELRIGPWMDEHREDFFLATKIHERSYEEARRQIENSLSRLRTEKLDLLQMHSLTTDEEWEEAFSSGGAMEAMVEAKEEGLVDYLGVTGHTLEAPRSHLRSLEEYDFDSVLLPCNYPLLSNPEYKASFEELLGVCEERNVALQAIKSVARRLWRDDEDRIRDTWYRPLEDEEYIEKAVHWVLDEYPVFIPTASDTEILPKVLEAAESFEPGSGPSENEMERLVREAGMEPLWPGGLPGGD